MQPDLSLVLPAFNEEVRLPKALRRMNEFALEKGLNLELVVVDDGSTDSTTSIVAEWQAKASDRLRIQLVEIAHRGKGAAVRAGMHRVTAPVVGYCDVDLSAGPDAIAKALEAVAAGSQMVITSRALPDSVLEVRQPWYRERAGRIFNFVLRKLARIRFKDTQCGLKLFRREVARELFRHQRLDGFAFDAELVVLAIRLGFKVDEIPVRWSHAEGSKLSLYRDSLRMARDIVRIVRRLGRGTVHALGVPSQAAMEAMTASEDRHWWYMAKRRLITASLSNGTAPGRCIDIGCGGGAMLAELNGSTRAFGVDLSTRALGHARSRGLRMLVSAEAGALPFAPASFSVALALDVLEHHARPEQLLREVNRVLDKDGILIVTVPAFQWMWSYADHVLGHYRRYTKGRLSDELVASGFALERVTYFHSWLLPIAWLFRKLRALTRHTESADDFELPAPLNSMFLKVSELEMHFLRRHDLPFGLSVLGIARAHPVPKISADTTPAEQALQL